MSAARFRFAQLSHLPFAVLLDSASRNSRICSSQCCSIPLRGHSHLHLAVLLDSASRNSRICTSQCCSIPLRGTLASALRSAARFRFAPSRSRAFALCAYRASVCPACEHASARGPVRTHCSLLTWIIPHWAIFFYCFVSPPEVNFSPSAPASTTTVSPSRTRPSRISSASLSSSRFWIVRRRGRAPYFSS